MFIGSRKNLRISDWYFYFRLFTPCSDSNYLLGGRFSFFVRNPFVKMTKKQSNLTKRELEVLSYVAKGHTSLETSKKLLISSRTVEKHRQNIMHKIGAKNMAQLMNTTIINNILGDK
ncbi:MAG: hypothetical protein COB62_08030 [Piscirickettsiaceae bacterium]|nr:MAG: hypothetical protein COB62_08030 [Piscirickettsiaceae bacterium]